MTEYQGHCHCRQTEWVATLQPGQQGHILCHCNTCKTLSGGAFTLNQIIPLSALSITKGSDLGNYTYQGDSGNSVHCYYCKNCTTHVYHHQEVLGPDKIVLRTGLLAEGIKEFKPAVEVYCKMRLPWEKEVAESHAAMPPE